MSVINSASRYNDKLMLLNPIGGSRLRRLMFKYSNLRYPECLDSCQEPPLSSKDPTLRDGGQGNLDRLTEVSWQFGAR